MMNRADQEYRVKVCKKEWARYLQIPKVELDYHNFKEAGVWEDKELRREG